MFLYKRFALAMLSGWATLAAIRAVQRHGRKQEKQQQKLQLNTWEGEGGNLPPRPSTHEPESVTRRS